MAGVATLDERTLESGALGALDKEVTLDRAQTLRTTPTANPEPQPETPTPSPNPKLQPRAPTPNPNPEPQPRGQPRAQSGTQPLEVGGALVKMCCAAGLLAAARAVLAHLCAQTDPPAPPGQP